VTYYTKDLSERVHNLLQQQLSVTINSRLIDWLSRV